MHTKFASEKIGIIMQNGNLFELWLDGNSKVTVGNGTFEKPVPNSFSLVQVKDCPFATPICKSVCYVHNLEKAEAEIHEKYQSNSIVIRQILADLNYQATTVYALAYWIRKHCPKGFRWHISGDIFSMEYSWFISQVTKLAQPVPCWIYTRSFPFLEPLQDIENLTVNLSADKDNWHETKQAYQKFGFRICYLTVQGEVPLDLPKGSVIFPSHELRGRNLPDPKQAPWWLTLTPGQRRMVCPPDFFGQSESLRCGPCKKCLKK